MSILSDAVFSSTSHDGLGIFHFDELNLYQVELIKGITKRQRARFKKKDIIPFNVLLLLHDLEMFLGSTPTRSMKILEFTDLLGGGWLYNKIVTQEIQSLPPAKKKDTFIKVGRSFMTCRQIRETMPGSIF